MDTTNASSSELTCRQLVESITDYLDGALPAPDHARFERHLEACSGCRDYLDQMRATIAGLGRLSAARLSADERMHLLTLFQSWK